MCRPAAAVPIAALAMAFAVAFAGCGSGDTEGAPDPAAEPVPAEADRDRRSPDRDPLAGAERLVFFGDSLAVAGANPYPDRLAAVSGRPLQVTNLSRAGTTSADWLPGGPLFEAELAPALAGADAVFVSVGGTDLERALLGSDALDALERADEPGGAGTAGAAFARIGRNLDRTFAAIEAANPRAVIVFVGYPDYSSSAAWRERAGRLGTVALRAGLGAFSELAERAGADTVIEMLDATAPGIDELLSDGEHLSDAGHQLYAEEIAERLAG